MSNEEIKNLMLEFAEHLSQARAIAQKLEDNRKNDFSAPVVVAARIDSSLNGPFKVFVHSRDLLKIMDAPTKLVPRDSEVYPFKETADINGACFYELCASHKPEGETINEAV